MMHRRSLTSFQDCAVGKWPTGLDETACKPASSGAHGPSLFPGGIERVAQLWSERWRPPAGWRAAAGEWRGCFHLLSQSAHVCMLILLYPHLHQSTHVAALQQLFQDEELVALGGQRPVGDGTWNAGRAKMRDWEQFRTVRWRSSSLGCLLVFPHENALCAAPPPPTSRSSPHLLIHARRSGESRSATLFKVCRSVTFNGSGEALLCFYSADVAAGQKKEKRKASSQAV